MPTEYDALTMKETSGVLTFVRTKISADKMPDTLNGESGHHICYVKMLTELIARELVRQTDRFGLDEEEIGRIALAACLHDIGKSRIPRAILEKRGVLTPVEYDIVKKHTILGGEMVERFGGTLDPKTRAYARDVCLFHHERFDGTGYPHGLKGDDIPVWAQIVSIADAYEAITSERSYKKALSRDVALEMISNGMCGVFDPLLIQCLIRVADHRQLEDIRSSLTDSRALHVDPYTLPPKKVLVMGNLRYVTPQFLEDSFPGAHISVIGKCAADLGRGVKVYDVEPSGCKAILSAYDFDFIVYFANELTYDTIAPSDIETLRQVMKAGSYLSGETKFLYLSSLDAAFEDGGDRGIIAATKENVCLYWARQNHTNLKIVRVPYLYNGAAEGDFLHDLFQQMRTRRTVRLRESEASELHFLSLSDLSELMVRLIDAWTPGEGILTVNDEFHITFGRLCEELAALAPGVTFEFTGKNPPKRLEMKNTALKQQYSWFAAISLLTDLPDEYRAYQAALGPSRSFWKRLADLPGRRSAPLRIAETLLLFLLCEFLVCLTDSALFFSLVDFRMAYIVVIATLYGLPWGMSAAGLCSLSWIAAKVLDGTSWLTLFYEPSNWLPFIFFFLVGGVCGYVKLKKDDQIRFTAEENRLLKEKLAFTRQIYEDTFREKQDLKKQIIGSKDSFGKIFDITRRLDTVDSRELYLKIVDSFEGILENKTLSVYSVSRDSAFARLEVASRSIVHEVSRSISLDTYAPVMEVLDQGGVWRNNRFLPHMPMFACGIRQGGKTLLLIFIWSAQTRQRSLYYVNLFRILCDLTQMSFIRAHEYSRTMHDRQYVGHTVLQNAAAFRHSLDVFRELEERRVFQFLEIKVDAGGRTREEMSALLARCVRSNDVAGLLEDGSVWLLLSQAGEEDLQFILPRFERLGLAARVAPVPDPGELPPAPDLSGPAPEETAEPLPEPAAPAAPAPQAPEEKAPQPPPAKPTKAPSQKPPARRPAARRHGAAKHKIRLADLLGPLLGGRR